jgi:hypothetical protein
MDDLEQKLNSVLSNPQLMQQIMSMAQSMGGAPAAPMEPPISAPSPSPLPSIDPKMLQALSGFAQHSSIDQNQRSLLNALHPYLNSDRISRLEKAMQAAKMARLASSFLGQNSLMSLLGR